MQPAKEADHKHGGSPAAGNGQRALVVGAVALVAFGAALALRRRRAPAPRSPRSPAPQAPPQQQQGKEGRQEHGAKAAAPSPKYHASPQALATAIKNSRDVLESAETFSEWLVSTVRNNQRFDRALRAELAIGQIKRQHRAQLDALWAQLKQSRAAMDASPSGQRMKTLVSSHEKASLQLSSLESELAKRVRNQGSSGDDDKTKRLRALLEQKRQDAERLEREMANVRTNSDEVRAMERAKHEWEALNDHLGITQLHQDKAEGQKEKGERTQRKGERFEDVATEVVEDHIAAKLREEPGVSPEQIVVLRNVTLGLASGELDAVVVQCPSNPADAVTVMAVVEAKSNIDDVGRSFSHFQELLAFLCGLTSRYDIAQWKTKHHPRGVFDRPFVHTVGPAKQQQQQRRGSSKLASDAHAHGNDSFKFERSSFRLFRVDDQRGVFLDRLFFVSRNTGATCVPSQVAHSMPMKLARDPLCGVGEGEECDKHVMEGFYKSAVAHCPKFSVLDVMRLYQRDDATTRQFVFVDKNFK